MDKAGKDYWDDNWAACSIPKALNPRPKNLRNYRDWYFHKFFCKSFSNMETKGLKLLEIGCARSVFLPYFAKEFGFQVTGLDYSEIGCRQSIEILKNEGVKGEVICSDFFSPPGEILEKYDVVVSLGVAEHFDDTKKCIEAFSKFLKPGGKMITIIPNLVGIIGQVQKVVDRQIYDIHVPLDLDDLINAHQVNGYKVMICNYLMIANFDVLNLNKWLGRFYYKPITYLRSWLTKLFWVIEDILPVIKPNRCTSPYIYCIAEKPQKIM